MPNEESQFPKSHPVDPAEERAIRSECHCKHELYGTGGVFLQGEWLIICTVCGGQQDIRKPIIRKGL